MLPRVIIDTDKIRRNVDVVSGRLAKSGVSLMFVTKGLGADMRVAELAMRHPAVSFLADSRVINLRKYADAARRCGKQTVLLRLPMHSEVSDAVRYADISLNSELSTVEKLSEAACAQGVEHKVVLMVDMGDLREGVMYMDEEALLALCRAVIALPNIELYGLGVNLTCYGGVLPDEDNLGAFCDLAERLEQSLGMKFKMISGGNSSSAEFAASGRMPSKINNLRLGEALLLGNDTALGKLIEGCHGDAVQLEAEIIELKRKPSVPIGRIGADAFGNKPVFEDKGTVTRAIMAIGRQDVNVEGLMPLDAGITVLGASSDHTLLDVTDAEREYRVGDRVRFGLSYGAMLGAAVSGYIESIYNS